MRGQKAAQNAPDRLKFDKLAYAMHYVVNQTRSLVAGHREAA